MPTSDLRGYVAQQWITTNFFNRLSFFLTFSIKLKNLTQTIKHLQMILCSLRGHDCYESIIQ